MTSIGRDIIKLSVIELSGMLHRLGSFAFRAVSSNRGTVTTHQLADRSFDADATVRKQPSAHPGLSGDIDYWRWQ